MIEKINEVRGVCDICKTEFAAKTPNEIPLNELRLPMRCYDECGRSYGYSAERVDVCKGCMEQVANCLLGNYVMRYLQYHGIEIEIKEK